MAALTKDRDVIIMSDPKPVYRDFPVGASEVIYKGSCITLDGSDWYAGPGVASERFVGIATHAVTAAEATTTNGTVNVRCLVQGVFRHTVVGATASLGYTGSCVFMSADGGLTLTKSGNSYVGRIQAPDPESTASTALISIAPIGSPAP